MSSSTSAAQQKFTNLRKRLDQLGYRQPLGIESLPLVERLFSDLVHTTESLKKTKLQANKVAVSENGKLDGHVEAYKSDNAKLVKENNELHQQLIKLKETSDTTAKELKSSLRKIEHENADLKFLNNQYVHKIRALEKETKEKCDKILQLQEKNFQAVVHTPGGRKKNIPFRRQRMDLDSVVPPSDHSAPPTPPISDDPYMADLLQVADQTIGELREKAEILCQEKQGLETKIDSFRKQVESRDTEIDRLNGLLEGGRPYDVIALEAKNRSNERLISHLNIQIDYLQQKNADLKKQVDEALNTSRNVTSKSLHLGSRNEELVKELKDVDRLAQQLEHDKNEVLRTADSEISQTRYELEKSRNELENYDLEMSQLRAEKSRIAGENTDLKAQVTTEQAENARLQDLLDKITADKRKLANRVNRLVSHERELVLELDRLKHNRNGHVRAKRGKSPNRLESFIKGLEEERDYWKGEVDVLQKLMRSRSRPGSRAGSRSNSRAGSRNASPVRGANSRNASPVRGTKNRSLSPAASRSIATLEASLRAVEEERDRLQLEVELLKTTRSRPSSPSPRMRSSSRNESVELLEVQQERDELQRLLNKFERHMAEIQANVKVLTTERDNLSALYEDTKEELTRLRRDVVKSPKSAKTSLAAQAVLRRVENERDDAIADLRRMTTERDTLRERLKIATETQIADRSRLDQRIEDLEAALHACERQRDDGDTRVVSLQRLVENLEDQLKDQAVQVAQANDDSTQYKANATQMRLLAEQAEKSVNLQQQQLTSREMELRAANDAQLQLETRIAELKRASNQQLDEISRLKATIGSMDREKDSLQNAVDDKTENAVQLEQDIRERERQISDYRLSVAELEANLDRAKETIAAKDRELASLRRQLDATSEELSEVGRNREGILRENRRLQDDLATMTRENQSLNADYNDALSEREELKNQVQDYVVEVKRAQDLIASKEQERTDLLEQYRALSLDAEKYETASHQLESDMSNLRLELMTKDSEVRRLREKVDSLEREIKDHLNAERSYEIQVSQLTQAVASLEDQIRVAERGRDNALQDLAAVRDLTARVEAGKDNVQRQLALKSLDEEKLQNTIEDLRSEVENLRDQLGAERSTVKSLEELLHSNREKEFVSQMTMQESQADLQLLKDRLTLNESKIDSQNREISNLRTRTIELEAENDRMRRTLTNERFERERAVQELRRNGIAPPGEGRLSRGTPTSLRAISPRRTDDSTRSRSPSPRRFQYT